MENKSCKRLAVTRNWADMNYDMLGQIFMMLSTMDLVSSISLVCSSWRAACYNPILWNTLDLASLKYSIDNPKDLGDSLDDWASTRLMQILNSTLILSGTNLTRLIFHLHAYIKDAHLIIAAERCPRLKQLVLPAWNQISESGFCQAIQKLKELESLTLPYNNFPSRILQLIGGCCVKLTELKIMSPFDLDFAETLFIYLPKLKVLSLRCSMVHLDALKLILSHCDDLEVLNISHSLLVDYFPSEEPATFSWEPDKSIFEQASRLKQFLWCQKGSCILCSCVLDDFGEPRWYVYQEGLWREDEISSFAV